MPRARAPAVLLSHCIYTQPACRPSQTCRQGPRFGWGSEGASEAQEAGKAGVDAAGKDADVVAT